MRTLPRDGTAQRKEPENQQLETSCGESGCIDDEKQRHRTVPVRELDQIQPLLSLPRHRKGSLSGLWRYRIPWTEVALARTESTSPRTEGTNTTMPKNQPVAVKAKFYQKPPRKESTNVVVQSTIQRGSFNVPSCASCPLLHFPAPSACLSYDLRGPWGPNSPPGWGGIEEPLAAVPYSGPFAHERNWP